MDYTCEEDRRQEKSLIGKSVQLLPGCQLDFVKKKVFLKGLIFKKKGFCNKKKGFPCQMDSFLIPAKGFFTSCILK